MCISHTLCYYDYDPMALHTAQNVETPYNNVNFSVLRYWHSALARATEAAGVRQNSHIKEARRARGMSGTSCQYADILQWNLFGLIMRMMWMREIGIYIVISMFGHIWWRISLSLSLDVTGRWLIYIFIFVPLPLLFFPMHEWFWLLSLLLFSHLTNICEFYASKNACIYGASVWFNWNSLTSAI